MKSKPNSIESPPLFISNYRCCNTEDMLLLPKLVSSQAPSNFTFCTSVRLSFPFPSITEHQHYFASTCLQRLSHRAAWTLSHWVVFQKSNAAPSTRSCASVYTSERNEGKKNPNWPKNQILEFCSSFGLGQNLLQGSTRFRIRLPTEATNLLSGSQGNLAFPVCISYYSLLTLVRLKGNM